MADCEIFVEETFLHYSLIPSVAITLLLSFLKKGNPYLKEICHGRPGIIIPVNLLDNYNNRWTFAMTYGATTTSLVFMFTRPINDGFFSYFKLETIPLWAKVFLVMIAAIEIGIIYYPFFACLSTPHKFFGSFLGFIYTSIWLVVEFYSLINYLNCLAKETDILQQVQEINVLSVAMRLPILLCLLFLWFRYLYFSTKYSVKYFKGYRRNSNTENICDSYKFYSLTSHHVHHVKQLFLGSRAESVRKNKEKLLSQWRYHFYNKIYRPYPFFKFSPRIIFTFVVLSIIWYQITITVMYNGINLLKVVKQFQIFNFTGTAEFFDVINNAWYIACPFTVIIEMSFIIHMMTTYRKHTLRLYKGDSSFLPPKIPLPEACIAKGLRYSGVQVAHFVWSIIFIQLLIWLIFIVIGYILIIPFIHGDQPDLFLSFLSYLVVIALVQLFQRYFVRYLFVQEDSQRRKRYLALKNRKLYHFFSYFLFFFDFAIGIFTCLLRIGKSLGLGIIFVGRLDRSIMMKGYGRLDFGYINYICMLYVENAHCHPVLVSFCKLLVHSQHLRQGCKSCIQLQQRGDTDLEASKRHVKYIGQGEERPDVSGVLRPQFLRARARWHLFYTLLRNPSLVSMRRPETKSDQVEQAGDMQHRVRFQSLHSLCCSRSSSPIIE